MNMTYLLSVFTIFSLILTSMQVTLQDEEEDVKSIIGAFYDGLCLRDKNCLRPLSHCDESLGVVSSSTHGIFQLDGRCRPVALVWILVAMVGAALAISACCCCLKIILFCCWPRNIMST